MEGNGKHSDLSFSQAMSLGDPIRLAMKQAMRDAIEVHHKLGQDVVTWRDGKVAIVPAAELLKEFDKSETNGTKS
jgi:hypothetical protein